MITKTGSFLLEKTALWGFVPRHAKAIYDAAIKTSPYVSEYMKVPGRLGAKITDLSARGLTAVGKGMVEKPGLYLPLAGAAAVGATSFANKQPAYEAHIDSPNQGVTMVSPFLGKIKFSDPNYAKYY